MKTISKALFVSATALGLVACGGDDVKKSQDTSTQSIKNQQYHNAKINLAGEIRDGVSNKAIDGVKITLVQGSSVRKTTSRKTNDAGLNGRYNINGIPATITYMGGGSNVTTPNVYKMVISKEGYRTLELDWTASVQGTENARLQNRVVNQRQSFKLYPTSVVPADIKVRVHFNGKPVAGKDVTLRPNMTTSKFGNVSQSYYIEHPVVKTDANGVATFKGNTLFAGTRYSAFIVPTSITINGQNVNLSQGESSSITAGSGSTNMRTIALNAASGSNSSGLYMVKANNDDVTAVIESGKLEITFNEDITLVSGKYLSIGANCLKNENDPDPTATDTSATLKDISAANANNLTVTVAGNKLTVTPNFDNAPTASTFNTVYMQYKGTVGTGSANNCEIDTKIFVRSKARKGTAYEISSIANSIGTSGLIQAKLFAKNK